MKEEIWKDIPGHDGYQASSLGRIRSVDRVIQKQRLGTPFLWSRKGQVIRQHRNRSGYLCCALSRKTQMSHRLVCLAFHGEPPPGHEVAHSNGVRDDNRASNLRWATRRENIEDMRAHGTMSRGDDHYTSKLTEEDVVKIRNSYVGEPGEIRRIAMAYGVTQTSVSCLLYGKTWKHAGGVIHKQPKRSPRKKHRLLATPGDVNGSNSRSSTPL